MEIGFIGLGIMGQPMAANLKRAGVPLVVWNRTPERTAPLAAEGAAVAETAAALLARVGIAFLMLMNGEAIDAALGRGTGAFAANVAGRTLVNMGTVPPDYSAALERDILDAGGAYLEAPVSGSRAPAETGRLIAMLAGGSPRKEEVERLLGFMCARVVPCGPVPSALRMKLAVNLYLLTTVAGFVEAFHFAAGLGLDLSRFVEVLEAGPMASEVSRIKGRKLLAGDFTAQAAIADVLKNSGLVADAAREAGLASPLQDACLSLYRETLDLGHGDADMVAVLHAFAARTAAIRRATREP